MEASKVGRGDDLYQEAGMEIVALAGQVLTCLDYKPVGHSPWECDEAKRAFQQYTERFTRRLEQAEDEIESLAGEVVEAEAAIQALRDWAWNADVESRPAHVVCSCSRVGAMHEPTCPISLWVNLTGQLNGTIRAILGPSPVFHPEVTGG